MRKSTETPAKWNATVKSEKPPFRPAVDDTKPVLQDPILRSDPMETEEAVLRLPPFPVIRTIANKVFSSEIFGDCQSKIGF